MQSILEQITDWLKSMIISGIMGNLSGMFDSVNQQVDRSPDAEAGTQCDNEGLKNGYCAVEKCHKCVPPCTLRPYGLMNSDFPSACAPANGQTYSQISNPNQKPGYVKRRQLAAPSYSVANNTPMTSSSPERTYLA